VVGLNPGPVATERLRELMQEMAREQFGDASRHEDALGPLPFGRAATQEEIADMVALLVSDRSAYTSGTIVTVDGGMTYQSA
jgi:NAD(P)-dependent dehydrogenase (short-subunit alcohol dehydrogenase family)